MFAALVRQPRIPVLPIRLWWIVRAFLERGSAHSGGSVWDRGILMTTWLSGRAGQFFVEKAYVLLVFAGIWAPTASINDIVRAFVMLSAHQEL